jgi:hypothetical protein
VNATTNELPLSLQTRATLDLVPKFLLTRNPTSTLATVESLFKRVIGSCSFAFVVSDCINLVLVNAIANPNSFCIYGKNKRVI